MTGAQATRWNDAGAEPDMRGEEVLRLVEGLHRNKDIDKEIIFRAIEAALLSAARKHFGRGHEPTIEIDRETGEVCALDGDQEIHPEELGRIAAQTAKQIIMQRIREAECDVINENYEKRIGTLVTGTVQRFEGSTIIANLERTEGFVPRTEQIPGEHYQPGERIRGVIKDVKRSGQKVRILLSRTDKAFVHRLFEIEVPEVAENIVKIHTITREPGQRTKIAVSSTDSRVDCIGACVGVRGTRIKTIIEEMNGEKIDIIQWDDAPEVLIANTLKPAEILEITLEEGENTHRAVVVVPPDQLSLAIGRRGQNVRLAARLTGWDIDIQTPEAPKPPSEDVAAADEPGAGPDDPVKEDAEALAETEEDREHESEVEPTDSPAIETQGSKAETGDVDEADISSSSPSAEITSESHES